LTYASPSVARTSETGGTAGCERGASVDDVDQAAAGASVAVGERVDRLEVRMRDRRLQRGREIAAVHERGEVGQEPLHLVLRRWDERGATRVVVAAADTVLSGSHDPGDVRVARVLHQHAVHVDKGAHCDGARSRGCGDGVLHRGDVREDRLGAQIAVLIGVSRCCPGEAAVRHDQPLDARRRHGLLAQQLSGERFEAGDVRDVGVELAHGLIGLVKHPRHRRRQDGVELRDLIRDVRR